MCVCKCVWYIYIYTVYIIHIHTYVLLHTYMHACMHAYIHTHLLRNPRAQVKMLQARHRLAMECSPLVGEPT